MNTRPNRPTGAVVTLPAPFSITVEAKRDAVTVAPRGELDLSTIDQLRGALKRLLGAPTARIVIDLRGVEFLDSTGLHLLVSTHAQAQQDDWELTIVPGPRAVQRIFEITRTIDQLPFAANGHAASG